MAGKSGRSINNVPESPVKKMIFSWEGILVLLFIAVNIFCAMFSEYYNMRCKCRTSAFSPKKKKLYKKQAGMI